MKPSTSIAVLPQPGQQVRWRHPRLAFAFHWFDLYGPGPFEVVDVLDLDGVRFLVIRTESGERKEIEAVLLGVAEEGLRNGF
jgi:hypothetical protein